MPTSTKKKQPMKRKGMSAGCFGGLFFCFLMLSVRTVQAQLGGSSSFTFLQIPSNARLAGLGGINVSLADRDVNMQLSNPALLDSGMHNQLAFNFVPFYADINCSSLAYARRMGRTGLWGAGLQYISYGDIPQTDAAGNDLGTFRASEFAFSIAHARTQGAFTLGISLKLAGSTIETYAAYALLADVGGVFKHPERDWKVALTIKNAGIRLSNYSLNEPPALPFDVQIGTTFKPEFMPVRFSITAHHLNHFDIAYNDPNQPGTLDANGNEVKPSVGIADKLARHIVLGGELLLHKNFNLRFGYNHLVNRELRLANSAGGAGFSFGAMLRVKAFEVAFSRAVYHAVGGRNTFTLMCDMGKLVKKKS